MVCQYLLMTQPSFSLTLISHTFVRNFRMESMLFIKEQHDEQWTTVTSRKLRGSLGSLRKVYFVGNIDDSCDADSITSHCVQNGITPTACRTFPSRKHVGTKAARLTVREDQCAAIEADGFWPAPIQVRPWDFSEANRPTATN